MIGVTPITVQSPELENHIPGTSVEVSVKEGTRLSAAEGEDSFSYVLAEIFTSGDDEADLIDKYRQCVDTLNFEIEDRVEGA